MQLKDIKINCVVAAKFDSFKPHVSSITAGYGSCIRPLSSISIPN